MLPQYLCLCPYLCRFPSLSQEERDQRMGSPQLQNASIDTHMVNTSMRATYMCFHSDRHLLKSAGARSRAWLCLQQQPSLGLRSVALTQVLTALCLLKRPHHSKA